MADGFTQVAPDSTGDKIDTSEITVGANTVQRQRINITDPVTAAALAKVLNADPASSDYGLVVRNLPSGIQRMSQRPDAILGVYSVGLDSATYTTTTANTELVSFQWTHATNLALILKVEVWVVATAFTTAGLVERQLIKARSYTVAATGGTSFKPAADNNELRTSFGTTLVNDLRAGVLTAGTRTLDGAPLSKASAWMGAAGNVIGGARPVPLWDVAGGHHPIVLTTNEGIIVRFGAAETASTRQTFANITWAEVSSFTS